MCSSFLETVLFFIWQGNCTFFYLAGKLYFFLFGRETLLFFVWQGNCTFFYLAGKLYFFLFGRETVLFFYLAGQNHKCCCCQRFSSSYLTRFCHKICTAKCVVFKLKTVFVQQRFTSVVWAAERTEACSSSVVFGLFFFQEQASCLLFEVHPSKRRKNPSRLKKKKKKSLLSSSALVGQCTALQSFDRWRGWPVDGRGQGRGWGKGGGRERGGVIVTCCLRHHG